MLDMIYTKRFIVFVYCLLLSGCGNPLATHYTNIKLAIILNQDASITAEEVDVSEVDVALIKSGNRPIAIIAKAFDENGKEKWISQDQAMLVFKHGRVIRTVGFQNDQLGIFSGEPDPLSDVASIENKSWTRMTDWSVGEYGYQNQSQFTTKSKSIDILGTTYNTHYVVEHVTQKNSNGTLFNETSWNNEYWFDKKTGLLLKTNQQGSSASDRFEIEFVSNARATLKERG